MFCGLYVNFVAKHASSDTFHVNVYGRDQFNPGEPITKKKDFVHGKGMVPMHVDKFMNTRFARHAHFVRDFSNILYNFPVNYNRVGRGNMIESVLNARKTFLAYRFSMYDSVANTVYKSANNFAEFIILFLIQCLIHGFFDLNSKIQRMNVVRKEVRKGVRNVIFDCDKNTIQ